MILILLLEALIKQQRDFEDVWEYPYKINVICSILKCIIFHLSVLYGP